MISELTISMKDKLRIMKESNEDVDNDSESLSQNLSILHEKINQDYQNLAAKKMLDPNQKVF